MDEERRANIDKNGRESVSGCNGCLPPSASSIEVRLPIEDEPVDMTMLNSNLIMSSNDVRFKQQRRAVRIDEICRFVFPLGFIIFNVCYWNYYKSEDVII